MLLGLDGTGDYSFVGLEGLGQQGPNQGTELSQVLTASPTPRLAGVFRRNRQGLWVAGANGSPVPGSTAADFQPSIQQILAQPDQPFARFDAVSEQGAERYIANKLQPGVYPRFGIRGNYWLNTSVQWAQR